MADIADKLDEARALIEKGWTQQSYSRGGCFCALGAIHKVVSGSTSNHGNVDMTRVYNLFADAIGRERVGFALVAWNDAPGRTQAEVIEAFKKAAALARAEA